jgi:hypothetical protein
MKKTTNIIILLSLAGLFQYVSAQQINTLYFIKSNPLRHNLNPAFQPEYRFYVGFPGLTSIEVGAGNNSLTFSDIYRGQVVDGKKQTISFLHPEAENGIPDFLDAWRKNLWVNSNIDLGLITFGFKSNDLYFTFDLSLKTDIQAVIPKAIPTVFFEGVKDDDAVTSFNLSKLDLSASVYSELALGCSYEYDEAWNFGGRIKFLTGLANIKTDFQDLSLKISKEKWILEGNGFVSASIPGLVIETNEDASIDDMEFNDDLDFIQYIKPSGYGLGFDLGATYNLLDNLQFSASVLDFGFIRWHKNINRVKKEGDFVFEGIKYDINNDTIDYWEEYADMLEDMFVKDNNISAYTDFLTTKVLLGAEYGILDDKISFGLLSKSYITTKKIFEELTVSANFRPFNPLSATVSYSLLDGRWSNLGFGLNLNAGPVNLFFLADNIPLRFAKGDGILIPTETKKANFSFGLNFVFCKKNKVNPEMQDGVEIMCENPERTDLLNIEEETELEEIMEMMNEKTPEETDIQKQEEITIPELIEIEIGEETETPGIEVPANPEEKDSTEGM